MARILFFFLISLVTTKQIGHHSDVALRKHQKVQVIGGDEALPHAYPYQVGLEMEYYNGFAYCGGSLISEYSILTAAHCVTNDNGDKPSSVKVYLGFHKFPNPSGEEGQIIKVTKSRNIIVHEKWDNVNYINDVAVIKLTEKPKLGEHIKIVDLDYELKSHAGEQAVVTGWGLTSDTEKFQTRGLRYVNLTVIENKKCQETYQDIVKSVHICTSPMNKIHVGTCSGDSGGPLVGPHGQIGIVSFGYKYCDDSLYPSVFTRVSEYKDWITKNASRQINSSLHILILLIFMASIFN